jgi:hypothetical protein
MGTMDAWGGEKGHHLLPAWKGKKDQQSNQKIND